MKGTATTNYVSVVKQQGNILKQWKHFTVHIFEKVGRDNSVGTTTRYGLGGLGIEYR